MVGALSIVRFRNAVKESRDVRHILIALDKDGKPVDPTKGNAVDYATSKALADRLYGELEGGADFAALAKKYSNDPGSKDSGGQLTITRGQTVPAFDSTAFLLTTKKVSRPVKTEFGYHVIQPVSDVKPGTTTSLKDARAQIESQLLEPRKQELITKWAEETKNYFAKKVQYATGFAPPAAATEPATTTG